MAKLTPREEAIMCKALLERHAQPGSTLEPDGGTFEQATPDRRTERRGIMSDVNEARRFHQQNPTCMECRARPSATVTTWKGIPISVCGRCAEILRI